MNWQFRWGFSKKRSPTKIHLDQFIWRPSNAEMESEEEVPKNGSKHCWMDVPFIGCPILGQALWCLLFRFPCLISYMSSLMSIAGIVAGVTLAMLDIAGALGKSMNI